MCVCLRVHINGSPLMCFTSLLAGGKNMMIRSLGAPETNTDTKAFTSLLLDKNGVLVAVGECARTKAIQHSRKNLAEFNSNFMYFEGFKIELNNEEHLDINHPDEEPMVLPSMGLQKSVPVRTLFQVIYEQVKLEMYGLIAARFNEAIEYLTVVDMVPATWEMGGVARTLKQRAVKDSGLLNPTDAMRKAAKEANVDASSFINFLMPSEPEAAALYATQNRQVVIGTGDIVMVIDNGAGTTDITTHEIGKTR